MKREGATVTHLTPAMGQILVGGASTEFSSLHHSFFVGDILIRRDVRRLQELAPNAAVVNMFGTTGKTILLWMVIGMRATSAKTIFDS